MILTEPRDVPEEAPSDATARLFAAALVLGPIAFLWAKTPAEKAAVVAGWTAGPFPGPFTPV